jgi:hypothetical protein
VNNSPTPLRDICHEARWRGDHAITFSISPRSDPSIRRNPQERWRSREFDPSETPTFQTDRIVKKPRKSAPSDGSTDQTRGEWGTVIMQHPYDPEIAEVGFSPESQGSQGVHELGFRKLQPREEDDTVTTLPTARSGAEIDAFLEQLKNPVSHPVIATARLIFALDATASREGTWDQACRLQGEMFEATGSIGGLEIQLVYYRGFSECRSSRWVTTAGELHQLMRSVSCVGGHTQIARVLDHAIRETQAHKVGALIFVGDCMEEKIDDLCRLAGELGKLGVPVFCFHEGHEPTAASAFKQIASLSGGVYVAFDSNGAERLRMLLGAVAAYAAGGQAALADYSRQKGGTILQLTTQLRRSQ